MKRSTELLILFVVWNIFTEASPESQMSKNGLWQNNVTVQTSGFDELLGFKNLRG
jgi:hypothetical protein